MSHFSVAVFHNSDDCIDVMLEPYCENTQCPDFLEFEPEETREEIEEFLKNTEDVRTPEEYAADNGYVYDAETDSYGYMRNPDARWDYFTEGGSWSRSIRLKPEFAENCTDLTSVPLAWVDTSPDAEEYKRAIRLWEIIVEHKPLKKGEKEPIVLWNEKYYLDQYKTKENFANYTASFYTYAFVTPDGEWHEPGKMGWWGMDNCTFESRMNYLREFEKTLEQLRDDPDIMVTILDCHI